MKKFSSYFKLVLVLAIFAASCKGPAGDTGPAGPQGPQGAQGAAGANGSAGVTGPAGKDGASGTGGAINATTSPWLATAATDWNVYKEDSTYTNVYVTEKLITQSVLDKGFVMAYIRFGTDTGYAEALPYALETGKISFAPGFDAKEGGFMEFYIDLYRRKATAPNGLSFRYVIIPDLKVVNPGGRLSSINWKDYNEVKRELNLKD
jgi:hypothetical protein